MPNRTHFQVYVDATGQFRWRLVAANGKIVADSAESYHNEADARAGITIVKRTNASTPVEGVGQ